MRVGWVKSNKNDKYAIKTMKKKEIIDSKHVDHIENEKNILDKISHPFVVSPNAPPKGRHIYFIFISSSVITDSYKMKDTYTS